MTAHIARAFRLSSLFIAATLIALPAVAETLIIVPANEAGSTTMTRDIAKNVVIPIMKAGKHKVIPYKDYRKLALKAGVKDTGLSSPKALASHGISLGATRGIEIKVLRESSKAAVTVVDLASKSVVFEKSVSIGGKALTNAEGKKLISDIYAGIQAKLKPAASQPEPEPTAQAATQTPATAATPEPEPAATPAPATAATPEPAPAATPAPAPAATPAPATQAPAPTQAEPELKLEPDPAPAPAPAPELKVEEPETTPEPASAPATDDPKAEPEADASKEALPKLITLRAGPRGTFFSSTVSDGTTEDLAFQTNAFIPGIHLGLTLAPVKDLDVPEWAKFFTLGFHFSPSLIQPQYYATTEDVTFATEWEVEVGYAPRAIAGVSGLSVGGYTSVYSYTMPISAGGFPDVGLTLLKLGANAVYDAGDILTIDDIVKGLVFRASTGLGLGLGSNSSMDTFGSAGMSLGYEVAGSVSTTILGFFDAGAGFHYHGSSTSFSGTSTIEGRREQFSDATLSNTHLVFQLFASISFL